MLTPGTVIAERYRLVLPLGERQSGAVWRAEDQKEDGPVALALVEQRPRKDARNIERFLETMEKVAALRHHNIVRVLDSGTCEEGRGFAALELLEGETLAERLAVEPTISLSDFVLIATGATNAEIAQRLFLSPHTVKEHTSSLYRKLGVRNRAEAVRRAERLGLT